MASSSETFAKFSTWKNLFTPLRVTIIGLGKSESTVCGRIDTFDEDKLLVGIITPDREFLDLSVEEADFFLEPERVVASRRDEEWLIFEVDFEG